MKKKVLVLGAGPEHSAVFNKELDGPKVVFEATSADALRVAKNADVIAVHVDKHKGFLEEAFARGYSGGIVAITTSPATINKQLTLPSNEVVGHVSWVAAPQAIMNALAT